MQQTKARKLATPAQAYLALYRALRTVGAFRKAKQSGSLSLQLQERLMLAVTEVNGCALCSYGHSRMALEAGLSGQEIEDLLGGQTDGAPKEELPAILFAQHYADTRGRPTAAAWAQLVSRYGQPQAAGMLGAVRMITVGNTWGIPTGSLLARLTKKEKYHIDTRSSVGYELVMLLLLLPFLPVAMLQALGAAALRRPRV